MHRPLAEIRRAAEPFRPLPPIVALFALVAFAGLTGLTACDDKKSSGDIPLAPSASSLAPSTAAPSSMVVKFAIDPASKTSIDMPAPNEHIKAGTTAAMGNLDVDLMNLANTRGEVKVDLTTITTSTFGDATKDAAQTEHARTWLEAADKLSADVKTANRYAVFAIRSIDNASATDVSKVAATKDGNDDVRTVTMTAKGDFLVHGHKVEKSTDLEAKLYYPAGATPSSKPTLIEIHSKTPLHVTLAEHDVKPRDDVGKIAKGAFNLLGTKVADTADVSLDLRAAPAP